MQIRRTLMIALCAIITPSPGTLLAAEGPRLPQLKDFHLTTAIVRNGQPAAAIVSPVSPEYQALAKKLQAHVEALSRARLDILADTDATDDALAGRNAILLGNLMTNRLSARLYCIEQIDVDAAWPGKGGYLLQTVHNPFGDGRNFVSLGGSDFAGVEASAAAFMATLKPGKDVAVGQLYQLKTDQAAPKPIDDAFIAKRLKSLKGQGYRTIAGSATREGSVLRKVRSRGRARLFRGLIEMLWDEMDKLKVCDDMRTAKFLPLIWDIIEESRAFTDDDRAYISNFMYVHAHKTKYAHSNTRAINRPYGNNCNARATYVAGLYFAKYYPDL